MMENTKTIENTESFIQVPVINKTESLFKRDPQNRKLLLKEISPSIKTLLDTEDHVATVKTDGTCAIIIRMDSDDSDNNNDKYYLMRRQDIKVGCRNFKSVMNAGKIIWISGIKCYLSEMIRGNGINQRTVPLYVFQLDENDKPEIENNHCIGFTPLLEDFGDDKHAIKAIDGINGDSKMKIWTTVFDNDPCIRVKCIDVTTIMNKQPLMTVELMGPKISARYGFEKNDHRHFINPHGSIVFPCQAVPKIDYESIKQWFLNDKDNCWANVEGIVVHFPKSGRRIKVHRGHVDLEKTWYSKTESGLKFVFDD